MAAEVAATIAVLTSSTERGGDVLHSASALCYDGNLAC
jgi:hypothetical protein